MTRDYDLGPGAALHLPEKTDYDLEALRREAVRTGKRISWARYHHALQAMYERGELVVADD